MICDANFNLLNVVAKWPGSVHDSRVFRESSVGRHLQTGSYILLLNFNNIIIKYLIMVMYCRHSLKMKLKDMMSEDEKFAYCNVHYIEFQ